MLEQFIKGLPKVELHLHIEGTFEPELMFEIAKRNNKTLKFENVQALKAAYDFNNLQEFLNIYYEGAGVLIEEQDFYDLTWAYLKRINADNVVHAEIFFDPQTHTSRGVPFEKVVNGISRALNDGKDKLGISSFLIMCFLRHLDEEDAIKTLEEALPFKDKIKGVELDSSEIGNPPSKFHNVFSMAKDEGFLTVAHAGEEGPSEYVWEALELLDIDRLDHGNRSLDDEELVDLIKDKNMALTICPLSNLKLKVVEKLEDHNLKEMLDLNLLATVNSDDPAYFGGYMNDNFIAITNALNLSKEDLIKLSRNGVEASFLKSEEKEILYNQLEEYLKEME